MFTLLLSLCLFLYVVREHTGVECSYGSQRNMDKEKLVITGAEWEEVKEAVMGYIAGLLERIFGLKMKNKETRKKVLFL